MRARETLTTTLTNLLARTRNGRMDAHRAEAERMVDAVLDEYRRALVTEIRDRAPDDDCYAYGGCDHCGRVAVADLMDFDVVCTCVGWQEAARRLGMAIDGQHHPDCKVNVGGIGAED